VFYKTTRKEEKRGSNKKKTNLNKNGKNGLPLHTSGYKPAT
jgi:hypothetical protein